MKWLAVALPCAALVLAACSNTSTEPTPAPASSYTPGTAGAPPSSDVSPIPPNGSQLGPGNNGIQSTPSNQPGG